jgi:hemerythrin superfamily protein
MAAIEVFRTSRWVVLRVSTTKGDPMAVVPTDDIVALLEQDHAAIQERLIELENADSNDRAMLFRELTTELSRHEVAEEMVVYPAIRTEPGGDVIADARRAEESEAEVLLAHMEKLDPTTEEFMGAVRDLRSAVMDHAAREETDVFPLLLAHGEDAYLALLGQKFRGEKLGAPTHPHPRLPNSALGNRVFGPFASFIDRQRDSA